MKSRKRQHFLYFSILLCLFSIVCIPNALAQKTYTFGIVPQFEARKLRLIWEPILQAIEKETGIHFIIRGSPTISEFEKEFDSGRFDFAYMNPYHIMLANQNQGYIPLVRDVGRKLYGILVVRKDSGIDNIKALNGKTIAFPAPNAVGASLMIRADLSEKYKIHYKEIFVNTHSSVYLNVLLKQAAAGGGVQKTFNQEKPLIQNKLKVIYETKKIATHPIAAHPRVPQKDRNLVAAAFLKLGKSEKGRKLLATIPIKKIGRASLHDYAPLRKMGLDKYYFNP